MDIKGLIKRFCLNVLNKIEDRIVNVIASAIIIVVLASCVIFWKWVTEKHSVEFYGWVWVSLCGGCLFLAVYFILGIVGEIGRLKNPQDVMSAIERWFARGEFGDRILTNTPYFFARVEKSLNLKRGSTIYLPTIALKHGYVFKMGKKTFTLDRRTNQNDPFSIVSRYLKPLDTGEKEVLLPCDSIDRELIWPKGSAKVLLLNTFLRNEYFVVEDMGKDKVRSIRKK
jgi:hypothetical protein